HEPLMTGSESFLNNFGFLSTSSTVSRAASPCSACMRLWYCSNNSALFSAKQALRSRIDAWRAHLRPLRAQSPVARMKATSQRVLLQHNKGDSKRPRKKVAPAGNSLV